MLGACGPDFWTVTSLPQGKCFNLWTPLSPDTAGVHFDLGHYNRSHQQFITAINRWRDNKKTLSALQVKVEQAYFYGMATHIATDCVVHQLVNVSAGAYHLLKKKWYDEDRKVPHIPTKKLQLWNTHNKVEHYWDSFIRYRYLGDIDPVFGNHLDTDELMTPLDFPTTEKFIADLTQDLKRLHNTRLTALTNEELPVHLDKMAAKEKMLISIQDEAVKLKIEKPFIFPRIFCDRVIQGKLSPFLYDIIVDKKNPGTAYEKSIIFQAAIDESTSYQMQDTNGAFNENKKLAFFASDLNSSNSWRGISYNYLNYCVCPDLDNLKLHGWDKFYHTEALSPFIASAIKVGNVFIRDLSNGIHSNERTFSIGHLGKFWNLDTGLGLEVKNLPSDSRHEVITELNFIHVTEAVQQSKISYTRLHDDEYSGNYFYNMPKINNGDQQETRAFNTYKGGPFKSLKTLFEKADCLSAHRYLDRIYLRPKDKHMPHSECTIENFFTDPKKPVAHPLPVATEKNRNHGNVLQAHDVYHRLTLNMNVPIKEIDDLEHLGFYLHHNMDKGNIAPDVWLEGASLMDFTKTKDKDHTVGRFKRKDGMCFFETQLLYNFEKGHFIKREIEKKKWNNGIDQNPLVKHSFARTFTVSTGRKNVLVPCSSGAFNGQKAFQRYSDVSPTEQIFFTLYMLVQTSDGCYDIITKQPIDKEQLQEIKKIDGLGFVKIVLFYQLNNAGAAQVRECYVDGMKVNVA
jgi:hypothetical protein